MYQTLRKVCGRFLYREVTKSSKQNIQKTVGRYFHITADCFFYDL